MFKMFVVYKNASGNPWLFLKNAIFVLFLWVWILKLNWLVLNITYE